MYRFAFLTCTLAFALAIDASAQVAVVNGGYATTAPAPANVENTATQLGIPSVPAINTPFAHVGPEAPPQNAVDQSQAATTATPSATEVVPVNLGVASAENPDGNDTSGRPLGDIAREMKQQAQTANAKTFTNADIQKLEQQNSGGITGATTNANATNTEWPANNGVITPPPADNGQGTIAAPPSQTPSTTGNGPFSPSGSNNESTNPPQANAKPSADRPYEMAQNNPSNAGIPQDNDAANSAPSSASENSSAKLPKTASRLPLLGVLGFFSISMGLFVRYQRAKDAR